MDIQNFRYIIQYGAAALGTITAGQAIGAGVALMGQSKAKKAQQAASAHAASQAKTALEFQKEQARLLEIQKEKYRQFEFKNPFAGIENRYMGMENRFEEMQVATRAAEFQMQQAGQQRANILQGLRGAAGVSGIAALAQSLAREGTLQAQQVSATLEQQEQQQKMLAAQESSRLDQQQRATDMAIQQMESAGEQWVTEAEMQRQQTLLGMEAGGMASANQAVAIGQQNMMQANMYGAQMQMQNLQAIGTLTKDWDQPLFKQED